MGSGPPEERGDRSPTTIAAESRPGARMLEEPTVNVLVIAWCPHEPDRVGEIAVVPPAGAVQTLGRGAESDSPRVRFFRPRPGALEPTEPLASPALSRRQLEVHPGSDEIRVRRVGQCPLRVNGAACDEATLRLGDTIRFRQELLLLYTRRQARIAPLLHVDEGKVGEFGQPDAAGILGESPVMWQLRDRIAFAAKAEAHVLLLGETGTGKELAARAVHQFSTRAGQPLVARNAATMPAGLIDAELFGNARNYPNPGMAERPGLVGQADGGFLFLDEIGELPSELQAHLLRVLDVGGEYQRLGESRVRRSDFRLLAATNREAAELKNDLVARLTVQVYLPPLRERREDIPLLVRHLVTRAADRSPAVAKRFVETDSLGVTRVRVDAELVDALVRRDYPRNTRELDSVLWAAMSASDGDTIGWHASAEEVDAEKPTSSQSGRSSEPAPRLRNQEPGENDIRAALARADGNVARAAAALGLSSRYALYRVMAKLGIEAKGQE